MLSQVDTDSKFISVRHQVLGWENILVSLPVLQACVVIQQQVDAWSKLGEPLTDLKHQGLENVGHIGAAAAGLAVSHQDDENESGI